MMKQTTCYGCDKPIEPEWLPEGEFIVCDECSSDTDEKTVEKLQEQLNAAKKALTEIASSRKEIYRGGTLVGLELTEDAKIAYDALAAIGGDDDRE
ncbi:hypothetical protein [Lactococcus cremoris]|uniref:Putative phage related protein n=1 Tax=Lactococcus cremoris subsp. cremoris GE214 TaxID=1415168 RepID=A0A084A7E5_LACLC|nr:hypothetical protein [Lactococcus cremoris]KEY61224.1 putative phage related protein [Lactococcus cremoris subsp. cremoris GE214]